MSGSGKTTVSLGLMASLKRRGLTVAPFKVGPDFIDPGHHAKVTGRISRNLDGWMLTDAYNQRCFSAAARGADVAVVEGVMGLFDGYSGTSEAGSTAQMARLLNLPVVLVVDAASMARSAAALVQGFENFDPELRFAGIIFNNLAGEAHGKYLGEALLGKVRMPCLGGIVRDGEVTIPERHLGLVTEDEHTLSDRRIGKFADLVDRFVDVERLLGRLETRAVDTHDPMAGRDRRQAVTIGVARDPAFCFYYQDNLDLLAGAGARLVFFSPLTDSRLPPDLDGFYLGGGYPELFAGALSKNSSMREAIGTNSRRGMPVYAECGGFMYLCESLIDLQGVEHEMAGCFPLQARMSPDLQALGYREITLVRDTLIGETGRTLRGHEFHYSTVSGDLGGMAPSVYTVAGMSSGSGQAGGFQVHNTLGSYYHLHFGSCPAAAASFVTACRRYSHSRRVS